MKKIIILIMVLIVLSSFVSADLTESLAHVLDFDDTNLTDSIDGLHNSSMKVTSTSATGINGNAWDFEVGSQDYVDMLDVGLPYGNDVSTFAFWIKPESIGARNMWQYTAVGGQEYRVTMAADGSLYWSVDTYNPLSGGSGGFVAGNWYHIVLTYNGTNLLAWVNGTEIINQADSVLSTLSDGNVVIGNHHLHATGYDGLIDEFYGWNRSFDQADVDELYNSGEGKFYPFELIGVPATPVIVAPSPADNSNNNTNVTLNVTHTSTNAVRYYLYFGSSATLKENDLYLTNVTRTGIGDGNEYRSFETNVSDGIYYWKFRVQNITDGKFSANTSVRTLIIDTVNPTIDLGKNNNFSIDNSTILNPYLVNLSINISFFDINLAGGQTLINITDESDQSAYSILNVSITGTTVNISEIVNLTGWSIGNYTIKLIATDSHTATEIQKYSVVTGINYFRYRTPEGNVIKIISDSLPLTKKTNKLKDRYDFKFNYLFQKDTYKFRIESYNKIDYIQNSNYKAHFVVMGSNGRGNWIDFENPNLNKKDYVISKIDDYTYEVEVTANGLKSFTFSSLGGLNTIEQHYKIRIASVLDIWVFDEDTGQSLNATATIGSQSAHTIGNLSGARLVNITKEITSVTLNASGYGTETKSISQTQSFHNLSFGMAPVSATKLYFYDESSNTLISGETFSVYLEKTGFSRSYSSSSNPYSITSLDLGLYKLKASSANYPERQYFDLNVSNVTTTILNIYLINSTDGAEKTFNIVGEALNPLEDVRTVFTRIINGTRTVIAEEESDFAGQVILYLDSNYEYIINFSKTNYEDKEISLEPTDSEYLIQMVSTVGAYNQSVHEGIRYKFEPLNAVLNNNTKYNFTFTLNSTVWSVTGCALYLWNGSTLLNSTASFTSNSCYTSIERSTLDMTTIISEAVYQLGSTYNFTVSQQYSVIYTYEGEFSLKNFLDDLSDFSMAGFDRFGKMMLAFIVIFIILAMASTKISFEHKEVPIFIFWALVGFFSYVNWFYLDLGTMPDLLGLKKWFIFYLMSLVCAGFIINKFRR